MGMIRFYEIYQSRKRKFIKYLNIKLDITNLLSFIHVLLLIIKNNLFTAESFETRNIDQISINNISDTLQQYGFGRSILFCIPKHDSVCCNVMIVI